MIIRILALMGSLRITVSGLTLLLVLTIWGTLYQVDHGLYAAQERFYQSWSFMVAGIIPFPGAQFVLSALFANLAASLLSLALQRRLRLGFLVTHAGLALMLAAGGVTFYFGRSAHLTLVEGETSNVAVSSQDWELAVMPAENGSRRVVSALDAPTFKAGRRLPLQDGRTVLKSIEYQRNCRKASGPQGNQGGNETFQSLPPAREPRDNLPGIVLAVERPGRADERLRLWGGDAGPAVIETERGRMAVGLRRSRLPLPAAIELVEFQRELHPGTSMARSYASQVIVRTGESPGRKVLIAMNRPLRLHGFTFYQSSFTRGPGGRDTSTLAVVENFGRLMPYIATGLTGAGMLLHFAGMLMRRLRAGPLGTDP